MLKILIVENEPIQAEALAEDIKDLGYDVQIEIDGNRAIDLARIITPDLILMDMGLNDDIDGIEIDKMIRKNLSVPIIILTANPEPETFNRIQQSGSSFYHAVKLRGLQNLTEMIQKVLGDQQL
jgi:CheY-like chemotaxis protein